VAGKITIRQPHDEPVQKANETRYGRSKASDGSALKGASSEVRRIGDKVSLNEAETLPVGIASVGTAVNALQRMCQVRECAVELRIRLAKPGSEIRGGRKAGVVFEFWEMATMPLLYDASVLSGRFMDEDNVRNRADERLTFR